MTEQLNANKMKSSHSCHGLTVGDVPTLPLDFGLGLVTCFAPWDLANVMPAEA